MKVNTLSRSGFKVYDAPKFDTEPDTSFAINYRIELTDKLCSFPTLTQAPIFTNDGKKAAFVRGRNMAIEIFNCETDTLIYEIPCVDAQNVDLSPLGNYLITWSRPTKPANGEETVEGNLKIWDTKNGTVVISFSQKIAKNDIIQWTNDEKLMFHSVSNELHIYDAENLGKGILNKVLHKGFTIYKVSSLSSPNVHIALFNPEGGGKPARVAIYSYQKTEGNSEVKGPLNSRTMFAATEGNCYWNSVGTSLLVHTHADVDNTNSSYYGATGLFLLTSDGSVSAIVSQSKEGPVYDVKWSPDGQTFIICAGNMPCHTTVYNWKGEPVFECGAAHRNSISFSPHGRFVCVAGFGNLAGEMDFYDTTKMKKLGTNSAHCTVAHSWSPDSRYFMTAVLAPRMNVDNGFKIFKYNGYGPVVRHNQDPADPLYAANWFPIDSKLFPNRGPSPKRSLTNDSTGASASSGAHTSGVGNTGGVPSAITAEKPKPAPYRPPGSTGALSDLLKRESSVTGKVKPGGEVVSNQQTGAYKPPVRRVPGMPTSTAKKGGNSNSNNNSGGGTSNNNNNNNGQKKKDSNSTANVPTPPTSSTATCSTTSTITSNPPIPPTTNSITVDDEKSIANKLKNLKKRLKQVTEIKEKKSSGVVLNPDQLLKLQSEESILQEISELEK